MRTVLFDVTRLLLRGASASATGIDRVALAYARHFLARADVAFVPVISWAGRLSPIGREGFVRFLDRAMPQSGPSAGGTDSPTWRRLCAALASPEDGPTLRAAKSLTPLTDAAAWHIGVTLRSLAGLGPMRWAPGSIYLNVSHLGLEQPRLLADLVRRGVKPVVMIHDLIPIVHPEFCRAGASVRHERRLEGVLDHAALVIANSRSTAQEIDDYAAGAGRRLPNLCAAPLGIEPAFLGEVTPPIAARPYFVCIGTIEPRKNLGFLLSVWARLARDMGDAAPRLVMVGRRGWENEAVIDLLERSAPVRRLVHEVSDLHDNEVARLIAGAHALLAPSLSEGFDLPVAEAAALGVPVIASDIAVHRELGGEATLIDPLDGPAWVTAIAGASRRATPWPRSAPSWDTHFAIIEAGMEGF